MKSNLLWSVVILLGAACTGKKQDVTKYPATAKVDSVDEYFGEKVADPYRWLENDTTAATAQWVKEQNELTFGYLDKIPYRAELKKRLESIINYERLTAPFKQGDYYYYYKNDGLQNQSVLYRKKGEDGTPEVYLDPNSFSKDGTTRLTGVSFTKDGSRAALQISKGGTDWEEIVVIDAISKKQLEDTIRDVKFTGVSWKGDEGFYFSTYDKPKGSQLSAKTQNHKLLFHKVGSSRNSDELVFGGDKTPRRYIGGYLTEDERFLIVSAAMTTTGNELYAMDLTHPAAGLVTLVGNIESEQQVVDNEGDQLIIMTNLKAPNQKVVKTSFGHPTPADWKEIVPESKFVISNISTCGKSLFLSYLEDAHTVVKQVDQNGKLIRNVDLPGIGSAGGFGGKSTDNEAYYTYTSFTYPTTVFKYDVKSGASTLYEQPKVDFDPTAYEVRQLFFASKDSTRVPMFVVMKKGTELNGKNPTILYGYGGFNSSTTPFFSASRIVWLENGGVLAVANIRGGGEYGQEWHLAGTKMKKQNVFDDFIAAGEYLIKEKYTSSDYLAIQGGSNGGLLVGAVMTQRPDLAKVALPAVGVMDMLRYHKFTAGAGWASDYGTADDSKEMFDYIHQYSPLHALKPGTIYPATLITTADHDDRVVPSHSFKFAATLQADNSGPNPTLIRIDAKSGHGSSNLSKQIETTTDLYAFTWYNMGFLPPLAKKGM